MAGVINRVGLVSVIPLISRTCICISILVGRANMPGTFVTLFLTEVQQRTSE
ncbi:hypothetical protein [Methanospirillum purgamenti]|uniref:hypothetical protein n=1 Tax=Methanospirillum purgamenti TaxID=2834276 RepID=UPI002A245835|nr:hypothetical protein [Methanospirillum hungatei]